MNIKFDKEFTRNLVNLARVDPASALDFTLSIVDKYPFYQQSWSSLSYIYIVLKDYNRSVIAMEKAVEIDPGDLGNVFGLGEAYLNALLYQEAIDSFTECISLSENSDNKSFLDASLFARGFCRYKLRYFDQAAEDLILVRDEGPVWFDKLRTKNELLELCQDRHIE